MINEEMWKEKVETALSRYAADIYDISAGYDVLRYAKLGYLAILDPYEFAEDFMKWYPSRADYLILRMALAKKLVFVPRNKNSSFI